MGANGHVDWGRRQDVLDRLDYRAVLGDLGMEVVGTPSPTTGWVKLRVSEDDTHPSGSYNIHTGRIKNRRARDAWDGSIFDLCKERKQLAGVGDAFAYLADLAGVDIGGGGRRRA
ncbi:MAG: hypothetical protein JO368_08305, partial [Acidimicrobiales bacterium]|nr:hypothetical protein [Acidimicrobiales bacterium]